MKLATIVISFICSFNSIRWIISQVWNSYWFNGERKTIFPVLNGSQYLTKFSFTFASQYSFSSCSNLFSVKFFSSEFIRNDFWESSVNTEISWQRWSQFIDTATKIPTNIKQGTGDLYKYSVASKEKLHIVVELGNVADEMKRVSGDDHIEDVVSKGRELICWDVEY